MARTSNRDAGFVTQLAHPVYLDTEMLVSFLASLEDGVSYSSEVAERYSAGSDREGEGAGKVSLPSLATLLGLTLSAEGRYKRRSSNEEGVESKFVREHTAASLFNRLRLRLADTPGGLTSISAPEQFSDISDRGLVELEGEIIGNPLKQVLDLLSAIGPYFGLEIDQPDTETQGSQQTSKRAAKRSGSGSGRVPQLATLPDQGSADVTLQDLLRILKREVERSPILDLLLENSEGVKAVLTVSRSLLSPEVEAYLIGGRFRAIGKPSAVIEAGKSISLLRRTVFGFGGRQLADTMFGDFNKSVEESGINMSLAAAVIDGPAIQILPLAIYL